MLNGAVSKLAIAIALLLVSAICFGKEYCDITDFKDHSDFTNHYQSYVSLVFSTDASNFSQRQRDLKAGASAIVDAVPVDVFGSFSSFDTWRSELKQKLDYARSEAQDTAYLSTVLSDVDAQAYRDCVRQFHPISITAVKQQQNNVTFVIDWNAPPLVQVSRFTVRHPQAINETDPSDTGVLTYPAQHEKFLSYRLTPNTPFHLAVESDPAGYSAAIDYMVVKYNECRIPANGVESLTTETVHIYIPNADGGDRARDRAWVQAEEQLKRAGHKEIKLVSERYDSGQENHHRSHGGIPPGPYVYDRHHYFTVTYDPVYVMAEHPLCGLYAAQPSAHQLP